MTNHWIDLKNSDLVAIIGSNAAENHPISFKWVLKAKERGAKLLSVDPRYTKTSSLSDLWVPIRSGTDIAYIGALINYLLTNDAVHKDYLITHTNAPFIVSPGYTFADGMFGELKEGKYTKEHWGFEKGEDGTAVRDDTLRHPRCVYQLMKQHYARYTLENASAVTGAPVEKIEMSARWFAETASPDKSATICYAMGTTQHTHGTQNVRSYAVLQLLLGNIGVAGGGINALRGESNVQGSTDHGLLMHLLPGYLQSPMAEDISLDAYLKRCAPASADQQSANWWQNYPKYIVSLLKAWYGDEATKGNEFAFHMLPKRGGNYSHMALFEDMSQGKLEGLILLGQNPAVGGPDAKFERQALHSLKWMVAVDLWETETMSFWQRPGVNPADVETEVFVLPAKASMEKEGSVSNSGRWAQWRYTAAEGPGDSRSDLWIIDRIRSAVADLYRKEGGAFADPILKLAWDYGHGEEPEPALVAREINGRYTRNAEFKGTKFAAGDQVPAFAALLDDGGTSCGCWIYSGSYTQAGNQMTRRQRSTPEEDPLGLFPNWAWCWPVNRRILYNRASCDARGVPYSKAKAPVAWDRQGGKWVGDVPDGPWPPPQKGDGTVDAEGRHSFIMLPDGRANLFSTTLADGPFPEHYEPVESPVANLFSAQRNNPAISMKRKDSLGTSDEFPIVATTYRVTEHWQAGAMTRSIPWLVELQPEPFVEMSHELAAEKGIANGDMVLVRSKRGEVSMRAVVTHRLRPFDIQKKRVHQVGLIWHFGFVGIATGFSANELTAHVGDANTMIPEYKAFLCDILKAPAGGAA